MGDNEQVQLSLDRLEYYTSCRGVFQGGGYRAAALADAFTKRAETDTFKKLTHDEIVVRDKANLHIFWFKDEPLEETENLPPATELAAEIAESLKAALEEFRGVVEVPAETPE